MDVFKQTLKFESQEGVDNKRIVEARITALCGQLESVDMDFHATQATRGAIKELRRMLAPPMPNVTSPKYSGMDFKQREGQ